MQSLGIFLLFSVLVHLGSYTGFSLFAPALIKNPLTSVTEVEILDEAPSLKSSDKPVVKQLNSPNSLFADQEARFSSEKTQRVRQETQVREIGPTQNKNRQASNLPSPEYTNDTSEIPEFARSLNSMPTEFTDSKLGNTLPRDIPFSDTTNLNTDSNIYYSFYDRVEQLFRVRWSERINYYWARIPYDFKKENLSGKIWSTTFEVVLKGTGEYHSATVLQSSGYKPFDEAAIFSFKSAGFFPNVPRAKVEADGFVRLKYRFNLHVGPYL